MTTLIFDIESNGLIPEMTKLHCLVIRDVDTEQEWSLSPLTGFETGLKLLMDADMIVGHNIIKFDIPAIQKIYPWFTPKGIARDTLVMARLLNPEIAKSDLGLVQKGILPRNMVGRYSLESFGYRLGEYKGDYKGGWELWSQEMQDYCEQDVEVTTKLWKRCLDRQAKYGFSDECIALEHDVAEIIGRQERNGIGFDRAKAEVLYTDLLSRRIEIERELKSAFAPRVVRTVFVPKVNNKTRGYVKGEPFTKETIVEFNPGSRQHIATWLKEMHGWEPQEFTEDGSAKVDDTILNKLPYPSAKLLAEYFLVQKRIGQIAEGKEAWLRNEKHGRIHGQVITNGACTGRMTHRSPNLAQVPSNAAPYGERCRELFIPRKGWQQIGCDADALELRCLAGYMAAYDGGEYIDVVLKGDKSIGTDMHSVNCRALGMDPKLPYAVDGAMEKGRDIAKVWFYAFIYGAGDLKLGTIVGKAAAARGKKDRANFLKNLPALGTLTDRVKAKVKQGGTLKGLDGRILFVRSEHASLNTLLQSAGAILMKRALVILDQDLKANGLIPGADYEFMGNIHDEWQLEAVPEVADLVGKSAAEAIRKAGEYYQFKCPLAGNYDVGASWKDCH